MQIFACDMSFSWVFPLSFDIFVKFHHISIQSNYICYLSAVFSLLPSSHQAWTLTWMYPWTWVLVVVVVAAELWATKSHPSPNWNFGLLTLWSRTVNLVRTACVYVCVCHSTELFMQWLSVKNTRPCSPGLQTTTGFSLQIQSALTLYWFMCRRKDLAVA